MGARRGLQQQLQRRDQGARRRAAPGAGPEVEGRHVGPLRRERARDPVLLHAPVRDRRHERARLAHRLHVGAGLRDLPLRGLEERREDVGARARGGQAARPRGDRPVPHPPDRGRHPRPRAGLRHVVRHEPVRGRDGLRLDGRPRAGLRLHRQGGALEDQGRGAEAPADRRRDRRLERRLLQRRRDARRVPGPQGREARRPGDLRLLVAEAREEHRLRDGADRAVRARHRVRGRAARRDGVGRGRARSRSSIRRRRPRSRS